MSPELTYAWYLGHPWPLPQGRNKERGNSWMGPAAMVIEEQQGPALFSRQDRGGDDPTYTGLGGALSS